MDHKLDPPCNPDFDHLMDEVWDMDEQEMWAMCEIYEIDFEDKTDADLRNELVENMAEERGIKWYL
jgi:hypothetical protein